MAALLETPSVNRIPADAPWRWLAKGWSDLLSNPIVSLGYGLAFFIIGVALTVGLWSIGLSSVIPAVGGCFLLAGPILAVGLYEISRRREQGETATWREAIFVETASTLQLAYAGLAIAFVIMVWLRVAQILVALFLSDNYVPLPQFMSFILTTPDGLALLVVGSAVGAVLALFVFMISAVSIPLMMDRDIDVATAMYLSVRACLDNKGAMLVWAWAIAVLGAIGSAAAFVGLIIVFPLIGHATWHAYRDLISPASLSGSSSS